MNDNPQTIQDVEALAAKAGITFSPEDYAEAHNRAEQRRTALEAQQISQTTKRGLATFVEAFNRFYPKFLQTLLGIGDVLISLTQTVLIGIGVPILLILLMVVEQQRVNRGMELFEVEPTLAAFGAAVLVLCNLVFELLISWREHRTGWTEPPKYEFSFRLWFGRLGYMVGKSTTWTPAPKSPALRFKVVLRIITFSILVLALAGSMHTVIEQTQGNWLAALQSVLTQSTLLQFSTWIGGLLFAVAAVFSAQALSQYVAQKVIEIVAIMQSSADDKPRQIADAAGLTAAMYLYARLKENQRARRAMSAVSATDMPRVSEDLSGTIPVTTGDDVPAKADSQPSKVKRSKIDTAVEMLSNDRTLRKLTTRELEEKTGIGRNTWATAKKRLGL